MLNPDSPIPLYYQLALKLMEQVQTGFYQPGDLLPSENEMASKYGIGRPTVRQAMEQLVRKKMVERRRGAGTFVSKPSPEVDLFSLAGTSQAFLTKGIQADHRIVETPVLQTVSPESAGFFSGESAYYFSRLISIKEEPLVFEMFFLAPDLFPDLDRIDLENRSLSRLVSEHYLQKPDSGRQTFKIHTVSKKQAQLLAIPFGSPVLEVERILNFSGTPGGIFSRLLCRTDKFAFSQTLNLGAAQETKE